MRVLLENRAAVDHRNADGKTVFAMAEVEGWPEMLDLLLSYKVDRLP